MAPGKQGPADLGGVSCFRLHPQGSLSGTTMLPISTYGSHRGVAPTHSAAILRGFAHAADPWGMIFIDFGPNLRVLGRGSGSKRCAPRFPASSRSQFLEIFHLVPKMALYPFPGNMETNMGSHISTNSLYYREPVLPKKSAWTVR